MRPGLAAILCLLLAPVPFTVTGQPPVRATPPPVDLASMRSGLESTSSRNYGAWVSSRIWVRYALGREYGYGWWMRELGGRQTYYAWGYGGQFIFLVPDLDLVSVTTSLAMGGKGGAATLAMSTTSSVA